jgi:hypothetical protein
MPLNISSSGDDKDIAMAIRYAVDNGAQSICLLEFSLHKKWVLEFQYAEEHNVTRTLLRK